MNTFQSLFCKMIVISLMAAMVILTGCDSDDGCRGNDQCAADEYCAKAPGDCDGKGECRPRPEGCDDEWKPVCGCDGNTYGNRCDAAASGVNGAFDGECCEPVVCGMDCPYGIKTDENGCETCECLEIDYCDSVTDCACGRDIFVGNCAVGNASYIDTSNPCPDFCSGITGKGRLECVDNQCRINFSPDEV